MLDLGTLSANNVNTAAICDTTAATFEKDVLAASMQRPVVVDLWAPWCGPCRQLMPLLEQAVTLTNGAVALAKINIDENPEIAQALRVQSVPTVYAFYQGQPVDGFAGMQSPQAIKDFIAKLLTLADKTQAPAENTAATIDPAQLEAMITKAEQSLWDQDIETALTLFGQVLECDQENQAAQDGMMISLLAMGEQDAARQAVQAETTPPRADFFLSQAALGLDMESLTQAVQNNPTDHQSRLDLARACIGRVRPDLAIETLLESIRLDRTWQDEAARKFLLEIFTLLGPTNPFVSNGRRQLSSLLFA